MNKILDKIRRKIIHKLHGVCPDEVKTVNLIAHQANPVKLRIGQKIPYWKIPHEHLDSYTTMVEREMAYRLADKMLIDGLIKFENSDNMIEDAIDIIATVCAIKANEF